MKKIFGLGVLVFGAILLTGCGGSSSSANTYSCTADVTDEGTTIKQTLEVTLDKNDKISSYNLIMEFDDKTQADQLYQTYEFLNSLAESEEDKIDVLQNGTKVTIKNAEKLNEENEVIGLTKEEFKKNVLVEFPDAKCE